VSDPGYLDHLFGQIKREKGELDILVANAAGDEYPPFGKITQERYDSIINVHVKGLFFCGTESPSATARWRLDHPEYRHRRQRKSRKQ
jgi:NAD(P)-dependent dehydrogenase (short-subunit alcohol dehydrogenase family)